VSAATKVGPKNGLHCVANCYMPQCGSMLLSDYADGTAPTDVLGSEIEPILQGLFGEVGEIMATAKKHVRDEGAYPGYRRAAEEEFGDALWYLAALCRRTGVLLEELFLDATRGNAFQARGAATDMPGGAVAHVALPISKSTLDQALFRLARAASTLIDAPRDRSRMIEFAIAYLEALNTTELSFSGVAQTNLRKVRGAFLEPDQRELIDFDEHFGPEEQLPRQFEIRINQRTTGRSYLRWNGVFIGDPLTDNIADPDGYRFHDVFHFAYAATLHWSPVMRALIRHKRKSNPAFDEAEDGGRAIVVEEGLSAWIFTRAKELKFFEGQNRVALGLLKTIGEFVSGYEVERCPLKLWERAILDGFKVFRQLHIAEGGWVIGDRATRTIRFEPLEWKE
jgi:hypothetical protein